MSAKQATNALQHAIFQRTGISLNFDDANTLRRAELTLHRWAELECGNGNDYGSWAIERDDDQWDQKGEAPPYMVHHNYRHGNGADTVTRTRIPDREAGALRRVKIICARLGLHYYHQTDPRGCALYVGNQPIVDNDYTRHCVACRN